MNIDNKLVEAERKERALTRTADQLANFGTLTSLGSTALYFVEQAMGKTINKKLNAVSLTAVAVGIGAVFASFVYRLKAGKVALDNDEQLSHQMKEEARRDTASTDAPHK
jgi:hypothetical protein